MIWLLLACAAPGADPIRVSAPSEASDAIASFLAPIPYDVALGDDGQVELRPGEPCAGCYALTQEGDLLVVTYGDLLGAQYGLAELLERWGFRFLHPFQTHVPQELVPLDLSEDGDTVAPAIPLRGLHLHTLHPIEGLQGTWVSSGEIDADEALARADAIIDWTVKQRANHLQWVGLDDIVNDEARYTEWSAHTAQVIDMAHARGLTVGLGIQLFGSSNLQLAFDLIDEPGDPDAQEAQIAERLALVTQDTPFDLYNLSFGEFFGEDPDTFIAAVDSAWTGLQALAPEARMSTVIHVGDSPDQHVEYEGEDMIYYFLAQFADPAVEPWVHSVMYYDLFEDPGGAYHHTDFNDHRDFLLERMSAGEPVGYFPESAYWIAFDNPVPLWLPLYARSRGVDLEGIAAANGGLQGLDSHVLFSSGWEWGYWLHDLVTLRMTFDPTQGWAKQIHFAYDPLGTNGEALAQQVILAAQIEDDWLITRRLAPYLAGRDALMDIGYDLGIVAAPDRVTLTELAAMEPAERANFSEEVIAPLGAFAGLMAGVSNRISALGAGETDPFLLELVDGAAVTAARAELVHRLYAEVAAHADGGSVGGITLAQAATDAGRAAVDRRHAALFDPLGPLFTTEFKNPTIYDYGYLIRAEELCFWERELIEAQRIVEGSTQAAPSCF